MRMTIRNLPTDPPREVVFETPEEVYKHIEDHPFTQIRISYPGEPDRWQLLGKIFGG